MNSNDSNPLKAIQLFGMPFKRKNTFALLHMQLEMRFKQGETDDYTKSFAILFCILCEVIINVEKNNTIVLYEDICEKILLTYSYHLQTILGGNADKDESEQDYKCIEDFVRLIQAQLTRHCLKRHEMMLDMVVKMLC